MKFTRRDLDIWLYERVVNDEGCNIICGYDNKANERRVHQYGLMKRTESNLRLIKFCRKTRSHQGCFTTGIEHGSRVEANLQFGRREVQFGVARDIFYIHELPSVLL